MGKWSEERESARVNKEAIELLLRSQGWSILAAICTQQVEMLTNKVMLTPLRGQDAVLEQEYDKGHVQGIRALLAVPQQIIDEAEAVLKRLEGIEDGDDD